MVPNSLPASFSTFSVARNYGLRVGVVLGCARQELRGNFTVKPFRILAEDWAEGLGVEGGEEERAPAYESLSSGEEGTLEVEGRDVEEDGGLPGYGDHEQY